MYISKSDALTWFEFFAELPEGEPLPPRQQEIALAVLSQIELAEAARIEALKAQIEAAGQDPSQLEALKDVRLTADSIAIPAPMIGELSLRIIEREENKTIKFETEQSPINANLWIQVLPYGDEYMSCGRCTKMRVTLKADLNPMIKMMVGKKLEEGIDKFADMLAMIPYNNA